MTFHEHLDVCGRCANEPFNLCEIGAGLLVHEAHALMHVARSLFEKHLQNCPHCAKHPTDLCPLGASLWRKEVSEYQSTQP